MSQVRAFGAIRTASARTRTRLELLVPRKVEIPRRRCGQGGRSMIATTMSAPPHGAVRRRWIFNRAQVVRERPAEREQRSCPCAFAASTLGQACAICYPGTSGWMRPSRLRHSRTLNGPNDHPLVMRHATLVG